MARCSFSMARTWSGCAIYCSIVRWSGVCGALATARGGLSRGRAEAWARPLRLACIDRFAICVDLLERVLQPDLVGETECALAHLLHGALCECIHLPMKTDATCCKDSCMCSGSPSSAWYAG